MRSQMLYLFVAISLLMPGHVAIASEIKIAQIPKESLPSQEAPLPEGVERGPKVIENPNPAQADTVGATEIKDADETTSESVNESPQPKLITVPGTSASDKQFGVRKVQERKTMAIALGGGGARGAAHIGVLRVLEQEKIPIDYIIGNSMGAIIGGAYAAGVPLEEMERRGLNGSLRKAYLPGVTSRILLMPFSRLIGFFKKDYAGLWSGRKFEKYMDSYLKNKQMEELQIPFSAVALNLLDGNAYRIAEGKLSTAIRASSSISPLLKPVEIKDKLYVDGGVRANLPASAAKDTGADVVVAVLVDEPLKELPKERFYKYKNVAARLADVVLAVTDEHQLQFADVIINPDVSGIPILSDEPEDIAKAIKAGEEAARTALPRLRKKMGLQNAQIVGEPIKPSDTPPVDQAKPAMPEVGEEPAAAPAKQIGAEEPVRIE